MPQINQQTGQPEPTPEEAFRESLDDVILIVEKLSPLCTSVDSMIEMLKLGLKNDSQLNMILHLVKPVGLRR